MGLRNWGLPPLWPAGQNTAEGRTSFCVDSMWLNWPCSLKKTKQKEPTIIQRYIKCSLACNICPFGAKPNKTVTRLSTPSSFHLCLLDMSRLPPHAPWNTKRWKTLASTFNKPSVYKTDGEILTCLKKNELSQSFHSTKIYCCSKLKKPQHCSLRLNFQKLSLST